jgi:pilus assembly protein CpaE
VTRNALLGEGAAGAAHLVEDALTRFGFTRLSRVRNLDEAIAQIRHEQYDLVLISLADASPAQLLTLEREIRKHATTVVIGTAYSADPDLILRAMRAGVHEFLVAPVPPEEFAGALERLMGRRHSDLPRGDVYAVYSAKGGLGTTSIAVNLAQSLAKTRRDSRVALADLVVTGGDIRIFLNIKQAYDLGDLVAKGDKVDADLLNSLLTPCPGGVWALPAGDNPELEDAFDAATIGSIVEHLRAHFGTTVLDCEHYLGERTIAALDAADKILLVTHLSIPSLKATQRALSICRRLGYGDEKRCVIVHRLLSADVLSLKEAQDLLQTPIYMSLPNDYALAASSLNEGIPVVMREQPSKLGRGYAELAAKISGSAGAVAQTNGSARRLGKFFGINKRVGNVS